METGVWILHNVPASRDIFLLISPQPFKNVKTILSWQAAHGLWAAFANPLQTQVWRWAPRERGRSPNPGPPGAQACVPASQLPASGPEQKNSWGLVSLDCKMGTWLPISAGNENPWKLSESRPNPRGYSFLGPGGAQEAVLFPNIPGDAGTGGPLSALPPPTPAPKGEGCAHGQKRCDQWWPGVCPQEPIGCIGWREKGKWTSSLLRASQDEPCREGGEAGSRERGGRWSQRSCIQIPPLPLTGCVFSGRLLNLSGSQVSHLSHGGDAPTPRESMRIQWAFMGKAPRI